MHEAVATVLKEPIAHTGYKSLCNLAVAEADVA